MGYTLEIGEGRVNVEWDEAHSWIDVVEHDGAGIGAPLNSGGDHGNSISPSYVVWAEFVGAVGLHPVFFRAGRERVDMPRQTQLAMSLAEECGPLLEQHPGAAVLTPRHVECFADARWQWVQHAEDGPVRSEWTKDGADWALRRLDWLCFWSQWAVDNCEHPVFCNG